MCGDYSRAEGRNPETLGDGKTRRSTQAGQVMVAIKCTEYGARTFAEKVVISQGRQQVASHSQAQVKSPEAGQSGVHL